MPSLGVKKRAVATRIQGDALAAAAVNSFTCAYRAGTVVLGLLLNSLLGWWWADDIAAVLFPVWLGKETLEAFEVARSGHEREGTST